MGLNNKNRMNKKAIILALASLIFLTTGYLGISLLNSVSTNFPFINIPNATVDFDMEITGSEDFENFKQFNIIENTGSNQTNVIIDPVLFTEINKYCYKDSIRVYKSPYGALDELVSQVYNLEPNARETFSSSPDFGYPSSWTVREPSDTNVRVLPRFFGYKKVVEFFDNTSTDYCGIEYDFTGKINGTYLVTAMTTTKNLNACVGGLVGSNGFAVSIGFQDNGNIYFVNGTSYLDSGISYEVNKWYTFKIKFDCILDTYSAWFWNDTSLDWDIITQNSNFRETQTTIFKYWIVGSIIDIGTFYVAAIDESWAIGYEEDRILYVSSANIAFIDNLTGSETRSYRVYYNSSPTSPAMYTNIVRTNYTVNFTDGGSAVIYTGSDRIHQYDRYGNEHMSGRIHYHNTATEEYSGGGSILTPPIISDGPIFIESWHVDDANEWSFYRYYANSYTYKYHNYSGSGNFSWVVFGAENNEATIDFNGTCYFESSSWQDEALDYTGISWQDHYYTVNQGKIFQNEIGDSNILVTLWQFTSDSNSDNIRIRECGFPNPANVWVELGIPAPFVGLESSFGAWQFYQDVGSTNITDKQDFVDNLYNIIITNPPTISSLGPRNGIPDTEIPNILEISINVKKPRPLDPLNITVHVTDNVEVSYVQIYTDLYGYFKFLKMNRIFGTTSDGYWSYNTTIPMNASKRTISYQIWANDTSGQINTSVIYEFKVKQNPKPIIIIPPGEDITIIIIIIIGSIAASSIVATTVVIRRRASKIKSKKVMKTKTKKGVDLGAKEIRRILAKSEGQPTPEISIDSLQQIIKKPFKIISDEIYSRVQNLKNLSAEDKELLLKDLATLDDKQVEEWLKEVEDLEN
ncbi:MAG: hypothetical protein ACFFCM_06505 [Promethearchaeota archaeon]